MIFCDQEKKKAITFSYDDGVTQDIRLIELLNKYRLKCTFNLNSELLAHRGILSQNGLKISHYKIHPEDIKSVYTGHEVAVHTLTHPNLTRHKESEIIRQVVEIITIEKPNPTYSVIKIYNRINSLVYVYEVHCWNHTWTLLRESTTRKDPHIPIKSNPTIRRTISA